VVKEIRCYSVRYVKSIQLHCYCMHKQIGQ